MPLSWNEIRQRAIRFSREWADASRERGEAQTFWNEFFDVFGLRRRTVAGFEEPVRNLKGDYEFIDLFWKGRLIAEHKSRGKDLSKAASQAFGYTQHLASQGRADECPRYLMVCDFARFALHDLEAESPQDQTLEFTLDQFHKHIRAFGFVAGYESRRIDPEDPANFKAVELLGNLHDRLEDGGYAGHDLQRFMVRVLFCLFAEDTGIFEPEAFKNFILHRTSPDAADLGAQLSRCFDTLNTPPDKRQKNLDEDLAALPYVNGDLFAERLAFADFDTAMRNALLSCCSFKWDKISPAVFGSLFQSIMDARARRSAGAHYTSERDIMKVIRSLFLDRLRNRFEKAGRDKKKLAALSRELGELRFLDPACGCGNFLVLAYRELRLLEMDILQARFGERINEGDIRANCHLTVDQFCGIEIEEWPVRIAEVALWLMDHQMNAELFDRFGQIKATVPLESSPTIRQANALRTDWNEVLPAQDCSYILGNPPFIGAKYQDKSQRADMAAVAEGVSRAGLLDYVAGWYFKAADYVRCTKTPVGFVSTNSITQGEQVGVLWNELFRRGVKIHFAHRTFVWQSEARGKAHVHVVIIGFGLFDTKPKHLYDYETSQDDPTITKAANISPYLVDGPDRAIVNRTKPICDVPRIGIGNKPIDGGNYLFTPEEKQELLSLEPEAATLFRRWYGSREFLNGLERWCLWLGDTAPNELRRMPHALNRVEAVRTLRSESKAAATRTLASTPTRFHVENMPDAPFLVVPNVSSAQRPYIPLGYLAPTAFASNLLGIIADATAFHFGVLSSAMHMAWVRQVCGRLKSDYRYSNKLVYNNYPWPQAATDKNREKVELAAQVVLDTREQFPDASLADLYDPLSMPPALSEAHRALDTAVDRCYRAHRFTGDRQRVEHLFALYEQIAAPLTGKRSQR